MTESLTAHTFGPQSDTVKRVILTMCHPEPCTTRRAQTAVSMKKKGGVFNLMERL